MSRLAMNYFFKHVLLAGTYKYAANDAHATAAATNATTAPAAARIQGHETSCAHGSDSTRCFGRAWLWNESSRFDFDWNITLYWFRNILYITFKNVLSDKATRTTLHVWIFMPAIRLLCPLRCTFTPIYKPVFFFLD